MFKNSPKMEYLSQLQIKQTPYINQQALQDGCLRFSKFLVFDPNISKKIIFEKIQTKHLMKLQKTRICVAEAGPGYAHAKLWDNSIIFYTQMGQNTAKQHAPFSNAFVGGGCRQLTGIKIRPLNSELKLKRMSTILLWNAKFKFSHFDLT